MDEIIVIMGYFSFDIFIKINFNVEGVDVFSVLD